MLVPLIQFQLGIKSFIDWFLIFSLWNERSNQCQLHIPLTPTLQLHVSYCCLHPIWNHLLWLMKRIGKIDSWRAKSNLSTPLTVCLYKKKSISLPWDELKSSLTNIYNALSHFYYPPSQRITFPDSNIPEVRWGLRVTGNPIFGTNASSRFQRITFIPWSAWVYLGLLLIC